LAILTPKGSALDADPFLFIEKLLGLIKQGYPTILIWGGIALSAPFFLFIH